jgi:hypothetical protein
VSKQFEDLAKDLASGVSRRKAFGRFAAGLGAVALGLFSSKRSQADDGGVGALCDEMCISTNNHGFENHGQCVSHCVNSFLFNSPF